MNLKVGNAVGYSGAIILCSAVRSFSVHGTGTIAVTRRVEVIPRSRARLKVPLVGDQGDGCTVLKKWIGFKCAGVSLLNWGRARQAH